MAQGIWAVGQEYERYVGRWSRLVAAEFVGWLGMPPGRRWLDVGCGTGALSAAVVASAGPTLVVAVDPSPGFVGHARAAVPGATLCQGDAMALPYGDCAFDTVVSGLVLNFVRDPGVMIAEMRRVTVAGGTVALYVWDYAGEMELMRRFWEAAAALDPAAAELDEGRRFPICRLEVLLGLLTDAGLREVVGRAIDVPTPFPDFDAYWAPFLGGQGPAPAYAMSLGAEQRERLRERLRHTLPTSEDGSIRLTARAWAVRGQA